MLCLECSPTLSRPGPSEVYNHMPPPPSPPTLLIPLYPPSPSVPSPPFPPPLTIFFLPTLPFRSLVPPIFPSAILSVEPQPYGTSGSPGRWHALETEPVRGEPCGFQTPGQLTIWPIEIRSVPPLRIAPLAPPTRLRRRPRRVRNRAHMRLGDVSFPASVSTPELILRETSPQCRAAALRLLCAHTISLRTPMSLGRPAPVIVTCSCDRKRGLRSRGGAVHVARSKLRRLRNITHILRFPGSSCSSTSPGRG